jgi:2-amino-4-hydroxy-6-hydroxymethyldihydropteridine diphosphokinase
MSITQPLTIAYLGLGSNIGTEADRMTYLLAALDAIRRDFGSQPVRLSSPYRSAPWGLTAQNEFLNAVAEIQTTLTPHELLAWAKKLEAEIGRIPRGRWGPREIDVDILLMEGIHISDADLTIPHAFLLERAFAAQPLLEIAPLATLPTGEQLASVTTPPADGDIEKLAWPERPHA